MAAVNVILANANHGQITHRLYDHKRKPQIQNGCKDSGESTEDAEDAIDK